MPVSPDARRASRRRTARFKPYQRCKTSLQIEPADGSTEWRGGRCSRSSNEGCLHPSGRRRVEADRACDCAVHSSLSPQRSHENEEQEMADCGRERGRLRGPPVEWLYRGRGHGADAADTERGQAQCRQCAGRRRRGRRGHPAGAGRCGARGCGCLSQLPRSACRRHLSLRRAWHADARPARCQHLALQRDGLRHGQHHLAQRRVADRCGGAQCGPALQFQGPELRRE
mmetsp:Transcript_70474/g.166179  ORF Transcript_70474/g.166179 Transcript_70474/m.166179 type:complete len:228 (-) Transcript_70474:576-1259(-)